MGPTPETRETSREPREERPLARDEERRVDEPQERVDDQEEERGERIDLQTLALAALASAAAALITSRLWARGAVISAAMTPVIVALVKEGLRKPSERVTAVGSRVASVSKSSLAVVTPRVGGRPAPTAPGGGDGDRAPGPQKPGAPAMTGEPARPREPAKPGGRAFARLRVFRSKRFHLRMALITGLLAFLIAVFALTVPELIVGDSVGSGGGTTLFGGGDASDEGSEPSEDAEGGTSAPSPDGEAPAPSSGQQPEAQPEEAPAPEEEPPAEEPPSQPVQPQVAPPSGG
jgi:hypothetical protein